jgi:hypothetical protein
VVWTAFQAPQKPIVDTILAGHVTTAIFKCDPIPPRDTEYTYEAQVKITDRIGAFDGRRTIPCGW